MKSGESCSHMAQYHISTLLALSLDNESVCKDSNKSIRGCLSHMLLRDCQWPARFWHGTRSWSGCSLPCVCREGYMLVSQPGGCQIFTVPLTGMYSMCYTLLSISDKSTSTSQCPSVKAQALDACWFIMRKK